MLKFRIQEGTRSPVHRRFTAYEDEKSETPANPLMKSQLMAVKIPSQGRRHEVLIGGGGGEEGTDSYAARSRLHPKFSFPQILVTTHFILKMSKLPKKKYVSRRKIMAYPNFWGSYPRGRAGGGPPRVSRLQGF